MTLTEILTTRPVINVHSRNVIVICLLCFIIICLYGRFRCQHPDFQDPLMKQFHLYDLDGWSLSHFLFFMMIGYMYPDKFYLSVLLGIIWELFESFYGKKRPGFLGGFGDCATTDPNVESGAWWYGRLSDIICNVVGLLVGIILHQKV